MQLTERDEQVLQALAMRVRLFSVRQLAGTMWNNASTARRRLARLGKVGLVSSVRVTARTLPGTMEPVVTWRPSQPPPRYGAVAWSLQNRWTIPPRTTTLYLATRRTGNLFGTRRTGAIPQPLQVDHDLGVSAVYLRYWQHEPELAARWLGEDAGHKHSTGEKNPDAFILREDRSTVARVIEFGGAYPAERVQAFHEHCEREGLAYELW